MTAAFDKPDKKNSNGTGVQIVPGISGLTQIEKNTYLVVHDESKPGRPRAGICKIGDDGIEYQMVLIEDGELDGGPLSDIESIAPIPGLASQFFILESGDTSKGRPPRRTLAQVELQLRPEPSLRIIASQDIYGETRETANAEGLVCWKNGGSYRVLIADRGKSKDGQLTFYHTAAEVTPAQLAKKETASDLRFKCIEPKERGPSTVTLPIDGDKDWRTCSDLYLDERGDLWGSAAQDLGKKGPFQSVVYRIGHLETDSGTVDSSLLQIAYRCDGIKIEALSSHHKAGMCYATDDEKFGGFIRPLPRPKLTGKGSTASSNGR